MLKPCDTRQDLPCLYMGKCRGRIGIHGPVRPLRLRSQIVECPCLTEVREWIEMGAQSAQRNAGVKV